MDAARTILGGSDAGSIDAMAPNEQFAIAVEEHEELVLEKVGPSRLSVGHRTDGGDNARNPEVVFRIEGSAWIPIEYTRRPAVHRHDTTGLDIGSFLTRWSRRLRRQGFVEAAKAASDTV